MNKVIEVDFLPREFQSEAFVAHSTSNDFGARKESRILIIDNDHNTTHLVKILLKKTGRYVVLEENDASRAHQSARGFRPDLILLKVVMPETDGGEVAARIHADHLSHRARNESGGKDWPRNPRAAISRQADQHCRANQRN